MESEGAPLNDQREQTSICFKAFMLKNSTTSNLNLYDHLARVLTKVMDERPENVVDVIEDMSHEVKRGLLLDKQSTLRDIPLSPAAHLLAEQQMLLFSWGGGDDGDQEVETPLPNVSEVGFLLEQAGVGLGREEMLRVFLALKKLVNSQPLARCRLWGKILGTEGNYLVAEGEYRDGEEEGINEETAEDAEGEPRDDAEVVEVIDTLPRSTFKPPPVVPTEDNRTGVNKFTYFVCREPGLPWMRLPTVTPTQITAARHIRKFFTGRLDAPIVSYPPFPGNEANYLRAQIARISAGTQGRCVWVNLAEKPEDDFEEEADEEVKEADEPEPEVGPPLLTPLSEDAEITTTPPWSSKMSSTLISQFAIAVLRSNLWPGAYAYASGKKFENIYFGWGLKFAGEAYTPTFPTMPQREYTSGPEITEALDPSLEEEQALKAALEEQKTAQDETEGLGGDEEDDD
ncbi:radial spoke head protein 6 homolog A isoform X2 [Salmo salar]|uniref:Radial spoke head protein 6 homolog A isoform X2 n=1 Tax=Salmo salar TaxID=8030 RepID=A0A1S3L0I5_SALSA|nr:radial spoke head protein 6 homolog A isoform X2 [Salmo salar]|eukprot:XP_013984428.1 PREDICTED: radial spoke head protein 6 homolog A-like isoform X3 [Salmo salar]